MNEIDAGDRASRYPEVFSIFVGAFVVFFLGTAAVRFLIAGVGGLALLVQDPNAAEPFLRFSETPHFVLVNRIVLPVMMFLGGAAAVHMAPVASLRPSILVGLAGTVLGLPGLWLSGFTRPTSLILLAILAVSVAAAGGFLARARRITSP